MTKLCLAPPASGKSFHAKHHGDRFLDADHVVSMLWGWPKGTWWKDWPPERRRLTHLANAIRLAEVIRHFSPPADWLLFNTNPSIIHPYLRVEAVVIIPWEKHLEQGRIRFEEQTRKYGKPIQPTDPRALAANRDRLTAFATEQGIPIYDSFDALPLEPLQ